MNTFSVLNMQTDLTTGWAARAFDRGLRVGSATGRFGDEIHIIKDKAGNFVKIVQNSQRARKLNASNFTEAQLSIVRLLQDCGLVH